MKDAAAEVELLTALITVGSHETREQMFSLSVKHHQVHVWSV